MEDQASAQIETHEVKGRRAMRQWLMIGWIAVVLLTINTIVSFVRAKHDDQKYRAKVTAYRSALVPGVSREHVEAYLRQQGLPFERSCCEPGVFSDRVSIGKGSRAWFCRAQKIYAEFRFDSATTPAEVASGADTLQKITVFQDRSCW